MAALTMKPSLTMTHSIFNLCLAGLMVWGHDYGFDEAEFVFLMRGGGRYRVIGTGSLELDN